MDNNLSGFDYDKDIMIGNNCSFKGEINSTGTVFVCESASVFGDINAESILVEGKITDGDITVVSEIRLLSNAIVYCNLKARRISSETGAVFIRDFLNYCSSINTILAMRILAYNPEGT